MRLRSVLLYLKGCCMGVADVIPGVSGGTIALIVGVYRELIHSLRSLNLRWVKPVFNLALFRDPRRNYRSVMRHFRGMNGPFLVTLGSGIITAILLGSLIIPGLLANYPVAVKALFFGLILASVWIPFRIVEGFDASSLTLPVLIGVLLAAFGFYVSNPNLRLAGSVSWVPVESNGQKLITLLEDVPSSIPAHRVYWSPQNRSLRKTLKRTDLELSRRLQSHRSQSVDAVSPKEAIKARSKPYEGINVPSGTTVRIPRLSYWYVFLAGGLAISAMILPGISGSYILLILGAYFFVLNSVKGFLGDVTAGLFNTNQALVILLFLSGATVGLLLFTRLLDYLLSEWAVSTAAGLSGLMIGCLRGVWPFRSTVDGSVQLVLPGSLSPTVTLAGIMFVVGFVIVFGLNFIPVPDEVTDPDPEYSEPGD